MFWGKVVQGYVVRDPLDCASGVVAYHLFIVMKKTFKVNNVNRIDSNLESNIFIGSL